MTASEWQLIIMEETGTTADAVVSARIASWWLSFADKPNTEVQYWHTYARVVRYLIGKARERVDIVVGRDRIMASQSVRTLNDMLAEARDNLLKLDPGFSSFPITMVEPETDLPNVMKAIIDDYENHVVPCGGKPGIYLNGR